MSSRTLKELRNLSPWQWDVKGKPVGPAAMRDFEKVEDCLSNRSSSRTRGLGSRDNAKELKHKEHSMDATPGSSSGGIYRCSRVPNCHDKENSQGPCPSSEGPSIRRPIFATPSNSIGTSKHNRWMAHPGSGGAPHSGPTNVKIGIQEPAADSNAATAVSKGSLPSLPLKQQYCKVNGDYGHQGLPQQLSPADSLTTCGGEIKQLSCQAVVQCTPVAGPPLRLFQAVAAVTPSPCLAAKVSGSGNGASIAADAPGSGVLCATYIGTASKTAPFEPLSLPLSESDTVGEGKAGVQTTKDTEEVQPLKSDIVLSFCPSSSKSEVSKNMSSEQKVDEVCVPTERASTVESAEGSAEPATERSSTVESAEGSAEPATVRASTVESAEGSAEPASLVPVVATTSKPSTVSASPSALEAQERVRRWWQAAGGMPNVPPQHSPAGGMPSAPQLPISTVSDLPPKAHPVSVTSKQLLPYDKLPAHPVPKTSSIPTLTTCPSSPPGVVPGAAIDRDMASWQIPADLASLASSQASSVPPTPANIQSAVMWVQILRNPGHALQRLMQLRHLQMNQTSTEAQEHLQLQGSDEQVLVEADGHRQQKQIEQQANAEGWCQQQQFLADLQQSHGIIFGPNSSDFLPIIPLNLMSKPDIQECWHGMVSPSHISTFQALLSGVRTLQGLVGGDSVDASAIYSGGGLPAGISSSILGGSAGPFATSLSLPVLLSGGVTTPAPLLPPSLITPFGLFDTAMTACSTGSMGWDRQARAPGSSSLDLPIQESFPGFSASASTQVASAPKTSTPVLGTKRAPRSKRRGSSCGGGDASDGGLGPQKQRRRTLEEAAPLPSLPVVPLFTELSLRDLPDLSSLLGLSSGSNIVKGSISQSIAAAVPLHKSSDTGLRVGFKAGGLPALSARHSAYMAEVRAKREKEATRLAVAK